MLHAGGKFGCGGYKLSGFGGKDKGRESHDQYTETKTIFLNLDR